MLSNGRGARRYSKLVSLAGSQKYTTVRLDRLPLPLLGESTMWSHLFGWSTKAKRDAANLEAKDAFAVFDADNHGVALA